MRYCLSLAYEPNKKRIKYKLRVTEELKPSQMGRKVLQLQNVYA